MVSLTDQSGFAQHPELMTSCCFADGQLEGAAGVFLVLLIGSERGDHPSPPRIRQRGQHFP